MMKKILLGGAMAAMLFSVAPAQAQWRDHQSVSRDEIRDDSDRIHQEQDDLQDARHYGSNRDVRREQRQLNNARRERAQDVRDWRRYRNYDYNRLPPGERAYYADRYYRDGRYYRARQLDANDRIYRGNDGRYYCRRPDGTTGLIAGALGGGVLGNVIAPGGSKTVGTIIGGGLGAVLGRSIARNRVECR